MSIKKEIDVNVQLGKRIRALRNDLNISIEELAFRCDINRNYLSDLERGTRNPTLKVIDKIAKGLQMEIKDLLDGIGEQYGID